MFHYYRYSELAEDALIPIKFDVELAKTSIKQKPKAITFAISNGLIGPGTVNLDIGGGKWDIGSDAVRDAGGKNIVIDPYARDYEHNLAALRDLADNHFYGTDTVTLSSVLNVIPEWYARNRVVTQAYEALKSGGVLIAVIHEGDKSGVGKITSINTYQANLKTIEYMYLFERIFNKDNVKRKGNVIVAQKM